MSNGKMILHNLISQEEDGGYSAICLDLDVATQGETREEAEANLKEAVDLYLESVSENGAEDEFIPRPAPLELWEEYFRARARQLKDKIKSDLASSFEFSNVFTP